MRQSIFLYGIFALLLILFSNYCNAQPIYGVHDLQLLCRVKPDYKDCEKDSDRLWNCMIKGISSYCRLTEVEENILYQEYQKAYINNFQQLRVDYYKLLFQGLDKKDNLLSEFVKSEEVDLKSYCFTEAFDMDCRGERMYRCLFFGGNYCETTFEEKVSYYYSVAYIMLIYKLKMDKLKREKNISEIVLSHSFSLGFKANSIEAKILQDADRLDALGAIGILRTAMHQPLKEISNLEHYNKKILSLIKLFNTLEAKKMAKKREKFVKLFLDNLLEELNSSQELNLL